MLPGMANLVMNEPSQCETFAYGVADEPTQIYVRRHRQYGLYLLRVLLPDPKDGQVRKERSSVASG